MFIVDAHLDIAYNVYNNGRNPRLPLTTIRASEKKPGAGGIATVSFPELQKGGVGLVFGTAFVAPAHLKIPILDEKISYHDSQEAHQLAMQQLDYYHRLHDESELIRLVGDIAALDEVIASHQLEQDKHMIGIVPLMEGADPIREPEEAEYWWERGLRLIGLAWDDTRYASGAWRGAAHGLTKDGHHLLEVMAEYGFILDLTHMSEKATLEALDRYEGIVVATHSNARALVNDSQRHLSDVQIRRLGEHGGVMGIVLSNSFLKADYHKGDHKELVTLEHVVAHIDHMCQLLGTAEHVGIGSDLDGGFGAADIPAEMDSVADLGKIATALKERGYETADIHKIMGQNWLNLLRRAWST
ncbi:MAG: membrane dipeptidase [Ardenticatenaceae bacterium]|nr:membrane dipeptidase [Ardenticatenaceae bacterium]